MNKRLIISILGFCSLSALFAIDREAQISELLGKMTLDEKIGQLNQLSGRGLSSDMVGMVRAGNVGSILNEVDPEICNALQHEAIENSRLHIPLIFARDVIHGFKTMFPIPLGQAATWNPALVEQGARISADEASSVGIRWTFSPMVDIARDPRWGRCAEGFGEDPFLTSALGVAMVKGYQGDDLTKPNTMAACVKHLAGYGASESGRDYNTTWIPEVQLRDTYLPPFRACVDAGAATAMCSFNDINGIPSSGNHHLLTDIFRREWGFGGLMVSDWASIQQMIPHGFSTDLRHAACQAANAGIDIDMESYAYISSLKDLVEKGEVPMTTVDSLVANVLRLKFRLGLFDNPYVDLKNANRFYTPANLQTAQRCAEESAVLLKNNDILPFPSTVKTIALIGPMADARHDQAGTWSFDFEKDRCVTPLQAFRQMYGEKNVIYSPGLAYSRDRDTHGFDDALAAAMKADVVVCCVGEEAVLSGEAHSRADISLPGAQTQLIAKLKESGKPLVVVIMAGRPLTLSAENDMADALLFTFHGGTMAGPAIANLLSGKANPSGRLPITFPRLVGQCPIYYASKNTGRPAEEMTLIDEIPLEAPQTSTGCTSFFLDAGNSPLFPFGYGLTYTKFEYGDVELSHNEMTPDGQINVRCTVRNCGNSDGDEVVQLYVRDMVGSLVRPVKELKGFRKIHLHAGETADVEFTLPASALAFHDSNLKLVVEPGEFQVWIAPDSQSGKPQTFKVKES